MCPCITYPPLIALACHKSGKSGSLCQKPHFTIYNGNTVLVFDLTARGECNSEKFTVRKLENVRINLKYSNALTETDNLILYGEFDRVLQIDANRNVVTDCL